MWTIAQYYFTVCVNDFVKQNALHKFSKYYFVSKDAKLDYPLWYLMRNKICLWCGGKLSTHVYCLFKQKYLTTSKSLTQQWMSRRQKSKVHSFDFMRVILKRVISFAFSVKQLLYLKNSNTATICVIVGLYSNVFSNSQILCLVFRLKS